MIAQVMLEVDQVATDKRVDHIKMKYASIDAVFDAIRRPLAEREVIMLPSVTAHEQKGDTVTLEMCVTFVDGVTGEERSFSWVGQGQDRGDKAVAKATTSALRTALLKAFMLPMGDDPEQDSIARPASRQQRREKPVAKPAHPTLAEVERELVKHVNGDIKEKFLRALCEKGHISAPEKLPGKTLAWVMAQVAKLDDTEVGAWVVNFANE